MPSPEPPSFPIRLRGYDRAAVDAHLRALAEELDARAGTLADTAGEQVRAVLAAAETSAAEIVAGAERDAARIRGIAGQAGDDVADRVAAAANDALARIEALRGDLETLLGALKDPGASETSPPQQEQPAAAEAPTAPDADAEEGARIVALDLALRGTSRDEADRYLAEHFHLHDRGALLDDVYASVGG